MYAEVHEQVRLIDLRQFGGEMPVLNFHRLISEALSEKAIEAAEHVWPGFRNLMTRLAEREAELEAKETNA